MSDFYKHIVSVSRVIVVEVTAWRASRTLSRPTLWGYINFTYAFIASDMALRA
jgi:hypothetical protein